MVTDSMAALSLPVCLGELQHAVRSVLRSPGCAPHPRTQRLPVTVACFGGV
jgi:hypothetical protein